MVRSSESPGDLWDEPTDESSLGEGNAMAALVAAAAVAEAEVAAQAAGSARAVAMSVAATAAIVAGAAAAAVEARATEARLTHDVMHDSLTGLPNKRLLIDRLTQALSRSRRAQTTVEVLFLDLDRFKTINDTLGHDAGDQLLIGVAHRLKQLVRDMDTVARVGGDEFVIVCENLGQPSDPSSMVERLREDLAAGVPVGELNAPVHLSIGAVVGGPDSTPLDLIRDADAAMYRAKAAGRQHVPG